MHGEWQTVVREHLENPDLDPPGEVFGRLRRQNELLLNATGEERSGISERERTDEALRESEERFRKIFEEGPLGMAIVDLDYRFVRVNGALCRMVGYSEQELTGLTFPEITHPEDTLKDLELSEKLFRGELPCFHLEKRYLKKDGDVLWIALTACVVRDEEGKSLYGLAMMADISIRKHAEEALRRANEELERGVQERTAQLSKAIGVLEEQIAERMEAEEALRKSGEYFRKLVETVNAIPWEADMHTWRFTYVGPQVVRILGYPISDWHRDNFWVDHIHPEDREYAVNFCRAASSSKRDFEFEYRMVAADGRTVWFRDLATVVPGEYGSRKLRGFMLDITERKRTEAQLRRSQEQLRGLSTRVLSVQEEERSRIAREVHDELGQALTSLKIDLAWLGQRLPEDRDWLHEKVRTMTERIDATIHAVRRISTELRPGILDHLGLVATLEWQVREFQDRTGIPCVFTRSADHLVIDAMRSTTLFRICQEALTNVVRHANATRVDVDLRGVGTHVVLTVRDNGRGISKNAVADPRSLGLVGMRERVLPWGGNVRIRGVRGKGTVVTVRIPVTEPRHGFQEESHDQSSDRR